MSHNVSDQTRNEVWYEYREAIRGALYYEKLHRHYAKRHQIATTLLILLGSGSVVTAIATATASGSFGLGEWVQVLLGAALAGVSAWVMVGSHAMKSAVALTIAHQCEEAQLSWSDLMAKIDGDALADDDVREERRRLSERQTYATFRSGDVNIDDDEGLIGETTDAANSQLANIYQHAS